MRVWGLMAGLWGMICVLLEIRIFELREWVGVEVATG